MIKGKIILIVALVFVLSGCSISFNSKDTGATDGGIFLSINQGNTWQQKVLVPTTSGRPKAINALNNNALAMDPSDNKAIYYGSVSNGLFYTYDISQGWQIAKGLGQATINNIAVDPDSKCIIYVAIANKIYKSTDCSRNWAEVYYDNDPATKINTIAIDHYNSTNIYIGTSRGEVIKSFDRGISWQTIGRFENGVKKIMIGPSDSRLLLAATFKKGLFRSTNSGDSWVNLEENLEDFKSSLSFRDLAIGEADPGRLILATNYGLLRSDDNGDTWSKIELITPEKKATINAVAVNPKDSKEIYYVTNTTFYRSLDGGENWTSRKLPTTRAGWNLLIDPKNPNIIYLAVRKLN